MVRTRFVPCSKTYDAHYLQSGGDIGEIFVGTPVQSGHGLGGLISGLFRTALPLEGRFVKPIIKRAAGSMIGSTIGTMLRAKRQGQPVLAAGFDKGKDVLQRIVRAEVKKRLSQTGGGPRRKRARKLDSLDLL